MNSSEAFDKAVRLGSDGVITDDLEMVQLQVTMVQDDPEYTELLLKKQRNF
ncbi:Glycerophosphoryl diester phosphodiesterase [Streptococcus oralis]|uniref:Glycerophosphoryl diester phosphodiesterase n=1 Tax=Streptococcus oralis TaxID=1303 RepID=A0A139PDJ6_STROR|nr:Glycerophosphoryl diester phosphodiesterase [Streptococcus oralis]